MGIMEDCNLQISMKKITRTAQVFEFTNFGERYRMEILANSPDTGNGCGCAAYIKGGKDDLKDGAYNVYVRTMYTDKSNGHKIETFVNDDHDLFMGICVDYTAKEAYFIRPEFFDGNYLKEGW
jgi:hypothetical protein